MKWIKSLIIIPVIISSCSKTDLKPVEIDVNVENAEYKVGQPVFFDIKSSADNIVFYSGVAYGDTLNEFNYKDAREIPVEDLQMSFISKVAGIASSQVNQLQVLVSTDFNGVYSNAGVEAANWTDITSQFALATSATGMNSGVRNLNQYIKPGKPLYVAFKYTVRPMTTNKISRDWTVSDFLITNQGKLGKHVVTNFLKSGFAAETAVLKGKFTPVTGRSTFSTTSIVFKGNIEAGTTEETTETWAISKPISTEVLSLGPDKSIPLKGYKDLGQEEFFYTYNRPGTYTATFVAFNINEGEKREISKQLNIVVKP